MILKVECTETAKPQVLDFMDKLGLRTRYHSPFSSIIMAEVSMRDYARVKRDVVQLWRIPGVREIEKVKKRGGGNGKVIQVSWLKSEAPTPITLPELAAMQEEHRLKLLGRMDTHILELDLYQEYRVKKGVEQVISREAFGENPLFYSERQMLGYVRREKQNLVRGEGFPRLIPFYRDLGPPHIAVVRRQDYSTEVLTIYEYYNPAQCWQAKDNYRFVHCVDGHIFQRRKNL